MHSNELCSNVAEIKEHPWSDQLARFRSIDKSGAAAVQNAFLPTCACRHGEIGPDRGERTNETTGRVW